MTTTMEISGMSYACREGTVPDTLLKAVETEREKIKLNFFEWNGPKLWTGPQLSSIEKP
jgi:hypothetical protein